jgi:hypothetical protein
VFFNEFVVLPYSVYVPGGTVLIEDMVNRPPLTYLFLVSIDFGLMFLGSQFFLTVIDSLEESLTERPGMMGPTKKGEVVKGTPAMYGTDKGPIL